MNSVNLTIPPYFQTTVSSCRKIGLWELPNLGKCIKGSMNLNIWGLDGVTKREGFGFC